MIQTMQVGAYTVLLTEIAAYAFAGRTFEKPILTLLLKSGQTLEGHTDKMQIDLLETYWRYLGEIHP